MRFAELAATSQAVAATRSRLAKVDALAALLARTPIELVPAVTGMSAGAVRQGRVGVGGAVLRRTRDVPPVPGGASDPGADSDPGGANEDSDDPPALTVAELDATLDELAALAGPGSAARREQLVASLLERADAPGQRLLRGLLAGEVRQGAQESLLLDAVARVAEVPGPVARRALMLSGDLAVTAVAALEQPRSQAAERLSAFGLVVGRPIRPMLASPADSISAAVGQPPRRVSVEHKLDGARIQVHRRGDTVRVFTRTLHEVTSRVPDLVAVVAAMPCETVVLDGESLTLTEDGRPRPFQETMARFGTATLDTATLDAGSGSGSGSGSDAGADAGRVAATPGPPPPADGQRALRPFFFDCLHLNGIDLLDEPLHIRQAALGHVAAGLVVPGLTTNDAETAADVLAASLAAGHEGVVVKDTDSTYAAGRRGAAWRKVKPVATLDLVVIGVEPGSGRRTGTLSNLHLGARDPDGGPPIMVGKTFKGMTDELLAWQTVRLKELAVPGDDSDGGWVVRVRPELVVEIALDGAQISPRYPGGLALRFARVVRYRPDKEPAQADTLEAIRALLPGSADTA